MATIYKRVLHQAVRQKWPRKSDQSAAWTDGLSPSGAAGVVAMMMDTRCWLWSWCWWWCRWISGQSATQTDGLSLVAGCLSYQTPCCKLRLLLPFNLHSWISRFHLFLSILLAAGCRSQPRPPALLKHLLPARARLLPLRTPPSSAAAAVCLKPK